MSHLFDDPEIEAKFNADCKALWEEYEATKAKAYRAYWEGRNTAREAARAAVKAKSTAAKYKAACEAADDACEAAKDKAWKDYCDTREDARAAQSEETN
jgi:hypothetical protein